MYNVKREPTYKEYLRNCSIYDATEVESFKVKEVELPKNSNEDLCCMNFKSGHKCIFGNK